MMQQPHAYLLIVNAIVSGMKIRGIETYIGAALIVWLGMAGADVLAGRKLRELRHQDN